MSNLRAAFAAAVVLCGAAAPLGATEPLRLEQAFRRVIQDHPDLAVLRYTETGLQAGVERAGQAPPLAVLAEAENLLGSGEAAGMRGAELTLSLVSVLERRDKRDARVAVALRELEALELLRAGKRLDVLAEVARRFLDAAAAQALQEIARDELAQRERAHAATVQRVAAGGAPQSVQLAADAARVRTAGVLARSEHAAALARRRLALLWGATHADFDRVTGDVAGMPPVPPYEELQRRLADNPELRTFAHEARLREARLQLTRSAGFRDLEWQIGVRRLEASSDWALVGSVSVALGSAARAEPGVAAAQAELAAIDFERDSRERALAATLAEAWGQLDSAVASATRIEQELLPRLLRAEEAAERAYRAGALSYLEWAQLQGEVAGVRRERLEASLLAHRASIELQRLTGEPLAAVGAEPEESSR